MSVPTIRFPPPPPTRNDLTNEQRAQLRRTSTKLGQVLGSGPHVLDLNIVPGPRSQAPPAPKTPTSLSATSRNPFRGHSRSKSTPKMDAEAIQLLNLNAPPSHSIDLEKAWRVPYNGARPPVLKIKTPGTARAPELPTIPGSPHDDAGDMSDSASPTPSTSSESSLRCEKMRRLRRRLGEGVPVELVFPTPPMSPVEPEHDDEDWSRVSTPTSVQSTFPLLPAPADKLLPRRPRRREDGQRSGSRRAHSAQRPSTRLHSISENATPTSEITSVGISVSAGMKGRGKSRRFVEGPLHLDQVGSVWGGSAIW